MILKKNKISENKEQGSITVISLMILVILTLLGMGALTSSSSDLRVSRNERVYRQNFSRAEAAVRAGAKEVKQAQTTSFAANCPIWLHDPLPSDDITNVLNWNTTNSGSTIDAKCRFIVRYAGTKGNMGGTGEEMSKRHEYTIYGRSTSDEGGEVIVQVGYVLNF